VLDELTYETFAGRVGEKFKITAPDGDEIELTLAEAILAPGNYGMPERRAPFSLIFHGPLSPFAPQATWPLGHPELEGLELFLVPIGPEGEVMRYQAVFT
jgi:hypothetical protein